MTVAELTAITKPTGGLRALFVVVALLGSAVAYVGLVAIPSPPHPGLDASWQFLLTYASSHHLQWGRDIDFTYGPLGYLGIGEFLRSAAIPILAYAFAIPALLLAVLFSLTRRQAAPWAVAMFVAVVLAVAADVQDTILTACAILAFAAACVYGRVLDSRFAAAYGILVGLASLMKVNVALDCALLYTVALVFYRQPLTVKVKSGLALGASAVLVFVAGFDADPMHSLPKLVACFAVGAFCVLAYAKIERANVRAVWKLPFAGGALLSGILLIAANPSAREYVVFSWEFVRGYSSAMSIGGNAPTLLLALVLSATTLVTLTTLPRILRGVEVGFAVTLFLVFKHGFVRADGHEIGYFILSTVIAVAIMGLTRSGPARLAALVVAVFSLVSLSLLQVRLLDNFDADRVHEKVRLLGIDLSSTDASLHGGVASLRVPDELGGKLVTGRVAGLPWELDLPYANDLSPAFPRIPQLYTAYTPVLDRADAHWFAAGDAPEHLLYLFLAIDGRHPFAEAPETSATIWCRYRFGGSAVIGGSPYTLLERGADRCGDTRVLQRQRIAWGEPFRLPAVQPGQAVRLRFEIHRSLVGVLAEFLWRLDAVTMRVSDANGGEREYRILPLTASDGILVQPLVIDADSLAKFFGAGLAADAVTVQLRAAHQSEFTSTVDAVAEIVTRAP